MAFSKQKREILRRKIQSFWLDFSHNRVGFAGLVIILAFVVVAAIAPALTPYRPVSQLERQPTLAGRYAAPSWFTIFPQFSNFTTTKYYPLNMSKATVVDYSGEVEVNTENLNINFTSTGTGAQNASVTLDFGLVNYMHQTPPGFRMLVSYAFYFNRTGLNTYFIIKNTTATPEWEQYFKYHDAAEMQIGYYMPPPDEYVKSSAVFNNLKRDSFTEMVVMSLYDFSKFTGAPPDLEPLVFPGPGVYGVQVKFEFFTRSPHTEAHAELYLEDAGLTMWGGVHGVLGTNFAGNDVWTELVYGTRVSLMVGVLAALAATTLGILYGVVSGYIGGFVDEFLMRVVDVLLCIPVLPILLVLMRYFRPNVYFVVVLIAIFGWQGLSRVIRSRVLSLKEMAFIESARASGASDSYLITRHLIPNVLPIAMSAMVLAVPGAIITEASLSFLGFGDPNAATWGRMLYQAYQLGGLRSWWVWLPAGFVITLICIGFVFIGHAIDEIINPRLRRRR